MFLQKLIFVCTILVLCSVNVAQAETKEYKVEVQQVPCGYLTKVYKYPTGLKTYQCCSPNDPEVIAPKTTENKPGIAVTRFVGSSAIAIANSELSICTDLSTLSPLEKIKNAFSVYRGACNRFSIYEHVVCSCSNSCGDANTFSCNCPGLPPGQLPVIKPQDSLGSQTELLGETVTPCNSESICSLPKQK